MQSHKKSAVKLGIYFGSIMAAMAGLLGLCLFPALGCFLFPDAILFGIIIGLILDVVAALFFGAACGLVYGLIMGSFMETKAKEFAPMRENYIAQRRLFFDGPANHMMGKEGVGGWMFLLNDTLYFKSHQQNVQVHELGIPLVNICKVECTKRGIHNTGLDITLMDGTVEKYVVNDREVWVQKINEACRRVHNQPHA